MPVGISFLFILLAEGDILNIRFAFPSWQKVLQTFCIHMVFLRLLSYVVLRVCKSNCFDCKSDLVHLCTWQRYECLKCVRQRERSNMTWVVEYHFRMYKIRCPMPSAIDSESIKPRGLLKVDF